MTSLYDASIVVALRAIKTEITILKKAEAWAEQNNVAMKDLFGARLYEDMLPLSMQIVITSLFAQRAAMLVAGQTLEAPAGLHDRDYDECRALLADSLAILEKIKPEDANGKEDVVIEFSVGKRTAKAKTSEYVHRYLVPTIYFHLTTMYDILRSKGVTLGKLDFLTHYLDAVELSPPL